MGQKGTKHKTLYQRRLSKKKGWTLRRKMLKMLEMQNAESNSTIDVIDKPSVESIIEICFTNSTKSESNVTNSESNSDEMHCQNTEKKGNTGSLESSDIYESMPEGRNLTDVPFISSEIHIKEEPLDPLDI